MKLDNINGAVMKYTRGQFTNEYYHLWEAGLLLPVPAVSSVFSVKYRKNQFDEYSRITLKAVSASDALERACYAITYASPWRPEDIALHAVYDEEDNLLWIDEPFYEVVQKKNEFRGMERRKFIAKFGITAAAILFGLRPLKALAGTTTTALSGTASGFAPPPGEQLYTTAGGYTWTVPAGLSSVRVVCVGGAGAGGTWGGGGGGGGGYCKKSNIAVTPGASISVAVGRGGYNVYTSGSCIPSAASTFNNMLIANGGYSVVSSDKQGGAGGTATGGDINYSGGNGGNGMVGGPNGPNGGGGRWGGGGGAAGSSAGNGGNGFNGNGISSAAGGVSAIASFDGVNFGAGGSGSTENGTLGSSGNAYGGGSGGYFHDGTSGGYGLVKIWWG